MNRNTRSNLIGAAVLAAVVLLSALGGLAPGAWAGPLLLEATNTPSPTPPNPPLTEELTIASVTANTCYSGCGAGTMTDGDTGTVTYSRATNQQSGYLEIDLGAVEWLAYLRLYSVNYDGDHLGNTLLQFSQDGTTWFKYLPWGHTPAVGDWTTLHVGISTRYVRLAQGIYNWWAVAEVEAYTDTPTAAGGLAYTVTAHSFGTNGNYQPADPALLHDGNTATVQYTTVNPGSVLVVDLGETAAITAIRFFAADYSGDKFAGDIDVSDDGETWDAVAAGATTSAPDMWYSTSGTWTGRYVRLTNTGSNWWAIGELEVYGAGTPDLGEWLVFKPPSFNYLQDPTFNLAPFGGSPWQSNWWGGGVSRVYSTDQWDPRVQFPGAPCDLYYWRLQLVSALTGGGTVHQDFSWPGGQAFMRATVATSDTETFGRIWVEDLENGDTTVFFPQFSFPGMWNTLKTSRDLPAGEYRVHIAATDTGPTGGSVTVGDIGVTEGDYWAMCPDWRYGDMSTGQQVPAQTQTAQAQRTQYALGTPSPSATVSRFVTATAQATATPSPTPAAKQNRITNCDFEKGSAGWALDGSTRLVGYGGATGPTYAELNASRMPAIWRTFDWPGGTAYVTYWVGPGSVISASVRGLSLSSPEHFVDNAYSTVGQEIWVKRFGAVNLNPGTYVFHAVNGPGRLASFDGLAITSGGYSDVDTQCGTATTWQSLLTQYAQQQTQQANATVTMEARVTKDAATHVAHTQVAGTATVRAQATATAQAQANATATAQAANNGIFATAYAGATGTAVAQAEAIQQTAWAQWVFSWSNPSFATAYAGATATVQAYTATPTPRPTNTLVVQPVQLTQAVQSMYATQTQQAAAVQTYAAAANATSFARATQTQLARQAATQNAQATAIVQQAVATVSPVPFDATAWAEAIAATAVAPYNVTATMAAYATQIAQGTPAPTPAVQTGGSGAGIDWPANVTTAFDWFKWNDDNTRQIEEAWDRSCDREPWGTICEANGALGDLGDLWSRADWASTGFEGEAPEPPDITVFIHAAPDILNGDWEWNTTGAQYSQTCELSVTWILGQYLTIPICFLWSILKTLGALAWIQMFWDLTMIWAIWEYIRAAFINKATHA